MGTIKISNADARNLWLEANGLGSAPTGRLDALSIIRGLGFVQLDAIQVVSRAHHHIVWSRNQHYREPVLDKLLAKDRDVFEHFTHDASVLPMEMYPMWRRQFRRMKEKVERSSWYGNALQPQLLDDIRRRISDDGPVSTRDFDTKLDGPREMWRRPPHKQALDYLWYAGELVTCHRDGFTKFYDIAERVVPKHLRETEISDRSQIDWLCRAALDRLCFGTLGEIRKFWDAATVAEIADWSRRDSDRLVPVEVQAADGRWTKAVASPAIEARLSSLTTPTSRLRILNPFDPAIRDRARLKRLFGFDYTVEMFVPEAKRQWGYYVYPLLEGRRFVGRIEVKAERAKDRLVVFRFWPEAGVAWPDTRMRRLDAELQRLTKLVGVSDVVWFCPRS
ncbi:winged helix-turn-helix domain-containing protein [Qingshengfaniella alkalisoli]|uniref:Winged helix-turn-helix domain-containing protein n=1 Tax=Qingshengfaniella alkalisoli TaxID=2599296 RepID=A0A5B8IC25_9RHOB|nr:crosslink repair DNA glycosylase YcaQ family protein [Qingshengfaniella alkalisoli]QDY71076.1 winged helix-turn-helix domain-containing protein [Qingshengfaniella alkalisoli]